MWSALIGGVLGGVAGVVLARRSFGANEEREGDSELRAEQERQWGRTQTVVRKAAHDFRNPLTTIRARAELLKRSLGNGHSSEVRHVDAILRNSQRLEAMVTELSTSFREGSAEHGPAVERASETPEPTPS